MAHGKQLKGKLKSRDDEVIIGATLRVLSGTTIIKDSMPLLSSQFNVNLSENVGTAITIEIDAPGFDRRRLTLRADRDLIDAGEVVLTAKPGLKLENLQVIGPVVSHASGGSRKAPSYLTELQFIVKNKISETAWINTIELLAAKKIESKCMDPSPGVIIEIAGDTTVQAGQEKKLDVSLIYKGITQGIKPTAIVKLEDLPCDQQRLTVKQTYAIKLDPSEETKVALRVPWFNQKSGQKLQPIKLEEWQRIEVRATLTDGRSFSVSAAK
jgi:hypothetical protein